MMKVYRGFDKSVGPISHNDWIYVTESKEQAKWYATKDGSVKDGAIIEYDMDKENMSWITLNEINSFAENENEYYTVEDLLWYQEDLADDLSNFRDGIVFQDPYSKKPHTIYIILKEECLKNGKVLSKEEFDSIQLNESYYINEVNEVLRLAGVQLNEEYEGLNRIAGFYWFDRHNWLEDGHFQLFKRKPVGVEELDPEDNEFDYYHLDDNGLEEDNKARFGIEKLGKEIVCYIESENKQKCLRAKKAIQKKFNNILIDKFQLSWGRDGFEELDESVSSNYL